LKKPPDRDPIPGGGTFDESPDIARTGVRESIPNLDKRPEEDPDRPDQEPTKGAVVHKQTDEPTAAGQDPDLAEGAESPRKDEEVTLVTLSLSCRPHQVIPPSVLSRLYGQHEKMRT
jgi:hypothetical protein